MDVRFLGHSAFELTGGKKVLIDPFLTGNPKAALKASEVTRADYVLVTHDHGDHVGDTAEICKRTGATLVAIYEIATALKAKHGIKAEDMNVGGTLALDGLKAHMVHAQHSCASTHEVGFMVEMDGLTVYHTGDTGLFGDMALLAEFFTVDLMLCPIGDRYTMGPRSAARAVSFVRPRQVIPMHYDTFPIIAQDPEEFRRLVGSTAEVVVLQPGQTHTIRAR